VQALAQYSNNVQNPHAITLLPQQNMTHIKTNIHILISAPEGRGADGVDAMA
jgi:hypothetical protein